MVQRGRKTILIRPLCGLKSRDERSRLLWVLEGREAQVEIGFRTPGYLSAAKASSGRFIVNPCQFSSKTALPRDSIVNVRGPLDSLDHPTSRSAPVRRVETPLWS